LYAIRSPSGILAVKADRNAGGDNAHLAGDTTMDTNTLLIILVVLLILGGGGFFYRRRI
jgi:LPXTG-motif cell wall-anchored protein